MLRAADEIYFVPEGTPLSTQLVKFQRNKKKVGLVVDEYGDIQGLVTVEDILEEIVGDFTTSMSPTLAEEVTPLNDGTVIIDGSANVREINKAFNWHLPEDEARTVNGIPGSAGRDPGPGTRVRIEQYDIDILDVQDNMIKQVKVMPVKSFARASRSSASEEYHGGLRPAVFARSDDTGRPQAAVEQGSLFRFRHRHHRGANGTAVQGITFLHHAQHVARRHIFRLDHRNGLVDVRIQRNVGIGNHFHAELTHHVQHRFQRQFDTFTIGASPVSFVSHFQRAVQAVDHRQQFIDEFFQRKFVRFLDIQLGTTTQVIFRLWRSITSRSRFCASASWASRFAIFSSRGSTCSAETSGSTASTSSCCSVIISSGACPSGVFCSLLLMNFSAFFRIHLANFAYYGDQFPGFKGSGQIVIIHLTQGHPDHEEPFQVYRHCGTSSSPHRADHT
jgi:hypothetical protein